MKKPSVTELIKLLDKPALLGWANRIGLEGIKLDDYRKKSASKGTSIHNQIENYILHGIPFEENVNQIYFDHFISDKQVVDVEQKIETDYFQGRYDIKLRYNDDVYICDFKSSNKVYLEQKLQLAAYGFRQPNLKLAIISIPDFTFKIVDFDRDKAEEILVNLSSIYKLKKSL